MPGDLVERALRREAGLERLLAAVHVRRGLPDHLDVAEREVEVARAEVEVVEPERLLEDRRVLLLRQRQHRLAVVEHVVAADLVGAVREPGRVRLARRGEQQPRAVGRAAGDDDDVARVRLALAAAVDDDPRDLAAVRARLEPHRLGVGQHRHVGALERRPDAQHLGVGLRVHQAREAVARGAPHAVAVRHVVLSEADAAGRVEGVQPGRREIVGELLDARLVADRGERVRRRRRRLGRVLAARAVDLVELLGERVVRLHLLVGDRPRGRDPVVVAELAEVLRAQAVQRGAVELRGAADEVVHLRLERLAVAVVPGVRGHVAVVDEHVVRLPVLRLARRASRRARAAARACRTGRGGGRACRRPRRCR